MLSRILRKIPMPKIRIIGVVVGIVLETIVALVIPGSHIVLESIIALVLGIAGGIAMKKRVVATAVI